MSTAATGSSSGGTISSLSITRTADMWRLPARREFGFRGDANRAVKCMSATLWGADSSGPSTNATTRGRRFWGEAPRPSSQHPVISDDGTLVAFKTGSNNVSGGSAVIFHFNTVTAALTTVYTNGIYALPVQRRFLWAGNDAGRTVPGLHVGRTGAQHLWQHPALGFPNRHQCAGQHQYQRSVFGQHTGAGGVSHAGWTLCGVPEQRGGFDGQYG